MKAEDKAKEIYNKYYVLIFDIDSDLSEEILISILAKECALIAVYELIKQEISLLGLSEYYIPIWWNMVITEIEKL